MKKSILALVILFGAIFSKLALAEPLRNSRCNGESMKTVWRAQENNLQVDISRQFDGALGACVRRLAIKNSALPVRKQTVYTEMMAEVPVAIWPVSSRLLIAWESGSAFWITVYDMKSRGIQKVLDVRKKSLPEITYQSNGIERLSFPGYSNESGGHIKDGPSDLQMADVYTWQGEKYVEEKNLPFANRFAERQKR